MLMSKIPQCGTHIDVRIIGGRPINNPMQLIQKAFISLGKSFHNLVKLKTLKTSQALELLIKNIHISETNRTC